LADRSMVSQRSILGCLKQPFHPRLPCLARGIAIAALFVCIADWPTWAAAPQDPDSQSHVEPDLVFDEQPYKIKVLVSFSTDTQITKRLRGDVLRRFRSHATTFVGEAWQLETRDVSGILAASHPEALDSLKSDRLDAIASDCDKVFVMGVRYEGDRFMLAAREHDVFFRRWGPVFTGSAREPTQIARELVILASQMFSPLARLVSGDTKRVTIIIKGGKLPTLRPGGSEQQSRYPPSFQFVRGGTLFRPMRQEIDDEGELVAIKPLPWTFYSVERREDSTADCRIISALRGSLPPHAPDPNEPELIAARSAGGTTKLQLVDRDNHVPIPAIDVEIRETADGPAIPLGTSDPDGRIVIPQNKQGGGVVWAIARQGRYSLAVLPILPGAGEEPSVGVQANSLRLDIEGRVVAVQEQIVDQVARRTIMIGAKLPSGDLQGGLIKKALDKKDWKFAADLLKQLKLSPTKDVMTAKLDKVKEVLEAVMPRDKWPPSAKKMFSETETIIELYFDENEFLDIVDGFEDDIKNGAEEAGVTVDVGPPAAPTTAAAAASTTPSPQKIP